MAGKGEGGSHPRMTAGYPSGSPTQAEEHKGLKESAQQMASQVGETAEHMRESAREFASGVADQAQETWRGAREGVQEGWSRVSGRARDIWQDSADFVRRYPIASLAAAFGLGCLTCAALFAASSSYTDELTGRMARSSS
jgi:ElaB/YqjD/DUF883 family membrane-anchored ribosome-binding protein